MQHSGNRKDFNMEKPETKVLAPNTSEICRPQFLSLSKNGNYTNTYLTGPAACENAQGDILKYEK